VASLGCKAPGPPTDLADAWVAELDRHQIQRSALIASVPGDEESVSQAVERHPSRFVGFFMLDPTLSDAPARVERALKRLRLRTVCLFPAMQRFSLDDSRVRQVLDAAAGCAGTVIFVHCGALSVGVRKKLGLPSRFDIRHGNPLDVAAAAADYPRLPFVIPHFGAGFFHEALMAADLCPNVLLDTSSSNRWMTYHQGLTLPDVFRQALAVAGPERLLFGTDSSFFPRGWNREIYDTQAAALASLGLDESVRQGIFSGNFDRLFPHNS
jgi:predicted TIM-barrel fold metal-dependent hydrolase